MVPPRTTDRPIYFFSIFVGPIRCAGRHSVCKGAGTPKPAIAGRMWSIQELQGDSVRMKNLFQNKLVRVAVSVSALLLLTGAQGEGCGGGDPEPPPPPPPPDICGPGEHLELICEPCDDYPTGSSVAVTSSGTGSMTTGGGGHYPNGTSVAVTSSGSGHMTTGVGGSPGYPGDPGAPPHPGQECYEVCVPDSPCPEGFYEEIFCEGWCEGGDPGICLDPQGCPPHPGPGQCYEECWSECIPVDNCGPGYHEEWICQGPPVICLDPHGCDPEPEECYPTCVPDGGYCGPGFELVTVCDMYGCWDECMPTEPCPPGMWLDVVCDEYGCYEICTDGYGYPGDPEPAP